MIIIIIIHIEFDFLKFSIVLRILWILRINEMFLNLLRQQVYININHINLNKFHQNRMDIGVQKQTDDERQAQ